MADHFTQFSCHIDVGSAANAQQALVIFAELERALDETESAAIGFEVEVEALHPSMLWLHDEGGFGEPEHVIAFVLRCAKDFDLQGRWGFMWSLSCSKPRLDGFGGGAQILDLGARASIGWIDCDHWLAGMLDPETTLTEHLTQS